MHAANELVPISNLNRENFLEKGYQIKYGYGYSQFAKIVFQLFIILDGSRKYALYGSMGNLWKKFFQNDYCGNSSTSGVLGLFASYYEG